MLFSFLLLLPAGEASAAPESTPAASGPECAPGCSCDVWKMMKDHADAVRARNNAYAAQVIKKNEPVTGLTCLDQQLKLTSHLGSLFSDKKLSFSQSTKKWCGMSFSLAGSAGATLSARLNDIVLPSLGNLLGSLGIANFIPNTNFNICAPTFEVPKISLPSLRLPGPLGACLPGFDGKDLFEGKSFGGQCAGLDLPKIACENIKKFWKGSADLGGGLAIEGGGQQGGTPYTSFGDLVSGQLATAGPEFKAQLGNDSVILNTALDNLTKLKGPGSIPSWPKTPDLPANASTDDIIKSM